MKPYMAMGGYYLLLLMFGSALSELNVISYHDSSDDELGVLVHKSAPDWAIESPISENLAFGSSSVVHHRSRRENTHTSLYERIVSYFRNRLYSSLENRARSLFQSPTTETPFKSKTGRIRLGLSEQDKSQLKGKSFHKEKEISDALVDDSQSTNSIETKERLTSRKVAIILNSLSEEKVCGRQLLKRHSIWPRITGGTKAAFGEWPWQMSLRLKMGSRLRHQCGATLLNRRWGITAAHCVYKMPPRYLTVRLGEYDFSSEKEALPHTDAAVGEVVIHPDFEYTTLQHDLALIRFKRPVRFQEHILPICLPGSHDRFDNNTAYATGWGRMYEDGPVSDILRKIKLPILESRECEWMLRRNLDNLSGPNMFLCAGRSEGGMDACEGDSGGPLVVEQDDGRWILAGLTSSGRGPGCGRPNRPGFYIRISKYVDWMNSVMNNQWP